MKATSVAYANIALVKYWGKRNSALNLPSVGSISITLDALATRTSVEFSSQLAKDSLILNGTRVEAKLVRVSEFLNIVRAMAGIETKAAVISENNFPTGSGLASSASGFAALALAASSAAGLELSKGQLSILARRGSGSAARSVFGGYVEMFRGHKVDGSDAFAMKLKGESEWPLSVIVCVTDSKEKTISSTHGMNLTADTSPYFGNWVQSSTADLFEMRDAIEHQDFAYLARVTERSCLKMHGLMLSAEPGLLYWNSATTDLIHHVRALRASGIPVCFTIDAGPQVKIICPPDYTAEVLNSLDGISGIHNTMVSSLGADARLVNEELSATSAA